MAEEFFRWGARLDIDPERVKELQVRARKGIDNLSIGERDELIAAGHEWLEKEGNAYEAKNKFFAAHDFEGLRRVAGWLKKNHPDSMDLTDSLQKLEEYEELQAHLNIEEEASYYGAYRELRKPIADYNDRYVEKRGTAGVAAYELEEDLVRIMNLSRQYDIAVPIASAGSKLGGLAEIFGMPTRIADIHAHNKDIPEVQWLETVSPEDFEGKRILIMDVDSVTGATIREAVKLLTPFKPEKIGAFFIAREREEVADFPATVVKNLPPGIDIHTPDRDDVSGRGDAYILAHEGVGTPLGKLRKVEERYWQAIEATPNSKLANALEDFIYDQVQLYRNLNYLVPGVEQVRESLLARMEYTFTQFQAMEEMGFYDLPNNAEHFIRSVEVMQGLPLGFANHLLRARYHDQMVVAAKTRGIENPHYPSNPLASFGAAVEVMREGYDVALIVGPEGFAYEPFFKDFGMETLAVNIPESDPNGRRSIQVFDDLAHLRGKRVIVIEDDIRSGATLYKLMDNLDLPGIKKLGLYLGQPERFQIMENIPEAFEQAIVTEESSEEGGLFVDYLASRNYHLFKN